MTHEPPLSTNGFPTNAKTGLARGSGTYISLVSAPKPPVSSDNMEKRTMKTPNRKTPLGLVAALAALFTVGVVDSASASPGFLEDANSKVQEVYDAVRQVIYYVGGLGLIVLAIFAFFGRFKWTHFFALAGGLFLVGATDQLIQYLGDGNI